MKSLFFAIIVNRPDELYTFTKHFFDKTVVN